ncbi:hypothetical protein TWF481_003147 [Arthrobotrys musiformis]|uniref:BTB domain-containing protein n=1 Tax=Arthrobotrys musiformis TaxID=47236 RepID=A0AAV9VRK6_9PEZI
MSSNKTDDIPTNPGAGGQPGKPEPRWSMPYFLTPTQRRELALRRVTPGDKFSDQDIFVRGKKYGLHRAITGPQSEYFERKTKEISDKNGAGHLFHIDMSRDAAFDRIVDWLYSAKGATEKDDIKFLADFYQQSCEFGISPLQLQIIQLVESRAQAQKFLGADARNAVNFLNTAFIVTTKSSSRRSWEILVGLCKRFIQEISAGEVFEILSNETYDDAFKEEIKGQIGAGRITIDSSDVAGSPQKASAAKRVKTA